MADDGQLTLVEHLGELRKRLIISSIAIIIGSLLCYNYIEAIIQLIVRPAKGMEFIYLSPPELFMSYVQISLVLGAFTAAPVVLFQIWMFIKPGLKDRERKYVLVAMFMGMIFLLMGVAFAYFVIVPMTLQFFVKLSVGNITPLFSFENYISFISSLILSFGLVFELPMIIILLTQLGLVSPNTFKKYRKMVILGIFIVSAILTPPDVVSQVFMAIPMLVLFEFSIFVSTIIYNKKEKEKQKNIRNEA